MAVNRNSLWYNDAVYRIGYTAFYVTRKVVVIGGLFYAIKYLTRGDDSH